MTLRLILAPLVAASRDSGVGRATGKDAPVDQAAVALERSLVERVRTGDGDAFRSLMELHFPHAVRFASGILGAREAAEDAAQEVFINIWANHAAWQPSVSVRAYVLGAVRHRALNVVKHRNVEARHAESVAELYEIRADAHSISGFEIDDDLLALRRAIDELPERRRVAITLRYEHGLSHGEVGAALGVSAKAAKELIARTLEALHARLSSSR